MRRAEARIATFVKAGTIAIVAAALVISLILQRERARQEEASVVQLLQNLDFDNPQAVQKLLEQYQAKFPPGYPKDPKPRDSAVEERLRTELDKAFTGVTLDDGVGLHQAISMDMYESRVQQATARANDEKDDWHKLLDDADMRHSVGGPAFLDAKGLRFHMPAYLTLALNGEFVLGVDGMLYALCDDDRHAQTVSLLNDTQMEVVRETLLYLVDTTYADDPSVCAGTVRYWKK